MPEPTNPSPSDPTRAAPISGGSDTTSGSREPGSTVKSGAKPPPLPGGAAPGLPAKIGRFEVRAVLGEGAFGRVYRGYDAELARDVAIKVPHGSAMTTGFRDRFLKEARAAATIHHPNVCPIYEAGTDGDVPFLVIHFVAGPTLAAVLEKRAGPFPLRQAAVVVRKLALGVAAAHGVGVVHRDLKPANVLVDEVRREVLITDFGVARVGDSGQTVDGEIIGTPAYMSPEQAMGKQGVVGPPADVYSLGVILYRLVAGRVPYHGGIYEVLAQVWEGKPAPPRQFRPDMDARLEAICLKAMAKEPGDRYPSAEALAEALDDYLRKRVPEESGEQPALAPANARPAAPDANAEVVEAELVFDLPRAARPMLALMQAVAAAVFTRGLGSLGRRVSEDGFAHELAAEVIRRGRAAGPGGLAPMLAVTAGANIADAQVAAAQAAWEVAAQAGESDRMALEVYLGQLPDAIRQAFKRADDPTGTSVPREFRADAPSVLAGIFPRRVPRFRGGQALPGRPDWTLVRWLGAGGFGEVWLAQHRRVESLFGAVKFGLDLTAGQKSKLARDAQIASQALGAHPHPSLVPLLDMDLRGDAPWLMYEYVGGGDLADLVLAWQVLPPAGRARAVAERLREVAEALAAPHLMSPPAVHRDLKPSNILRDPRTFRLRVTDFGAGGAAVDGQVRRRAEGGEAAPRGAHSLLYASPQQLRGDPADPRDDVHALGVLGYQMLTGQLTAGVPADYDRVLRGLGVPPAFVQLLGACSSADAKARPRDAKALLPLLAPHAADPVLPPSAGGPAPKAGASAPVVFELGADKATETEVLVCPVCRARLRVAAGRTQPVPCPKCSTKFVPAAGRAALKVKAKGGPEPLSLDDAPEPDPTPPPRPKKRPRADDEPEPRRPRRSYRRLLSCGLFLALVGGLTAAGVVYQDELTVWAEGRRAKPVEFLPVREFEPGADTARVYGFLTGETGLLLTNADRKDVFAAVWNLRTGRREYVLKGGSNLPSATIDTRITQFRYYRVSNKLAVFNRDPQGLDRGGVWVYDLPGAPGDEPPDDPKQGAPKGAAGGPGGREAAAAEYGPRRRVWDVSWDLGRAVSEPKGNKVTLWRLPAGDPVTDLSVDGSTFRAVGFSPDGRYAVGLCDESRVRLWDVYTGQLDRTVRLGTRPLWDGSETGALSFDPEFTRLVITTESKTGSWDLKTGDVIDPMKKLPDGVLLRQKYRLRPESGGRGTFSVFHDEFTLRANRHATGGDAALNAWAVSDDREHLAAASNRKVQVWKLKYPPEGQ